jgi:glutamine---fructose-6-phosphate transaminase (isomerizing)
MCGIVGAVAQRSVIAILLEGLRRLEYRGYDSAGVALIKNTSDGAVLAVCKEAGKVSSLEEAINNSPLNGTVGIAHTRWATHGKPSRDNAHPHSSNTIALVHNGIIENHSELRQSLIAKGYQFVSQTDTEVVVHLVDDYRRQGHSLLGSVQKTISQCEGAYALGVIDSNEPGHMIAARSGSPLVVGLGIEENFIASDQLALRQVTDRFIYLEEGDIAEISANSIRIFTKTGKAVTRDVIVLSDNEQLADRGKYRHYMLKEIFEQPAVLQRTLNGRVGKERLLENAFGVEAAAIFDRVKHVQIIACGTSYHAGLVAKYWMEDWGNISCSIEVASEFRYRKTCVQPDSLVVTISQSGETADTLAALRKAKEIGYIASLTVCNVANSSLVRESDLMLMTEAGPEVGVASTKAFTTQLVALQLLTIALGRRHGLTAGKEKQIIEALHTLPALCEQVLALDKVIEKISEEFIDKHHALFLGRGVQYPIALEGALKLKEISYIHAEAYPAGELKHGPLALVDNDMPIIAVAPNNQLLDKLKSNLEEVQARGGRLFVFTDSNTGFTQTDECTVIVLPPISEYLSPLLYTLPLQLLSYHVAVFKGTDIDQPRNLAKSVTVE